MTKIQNLTAQEILDSRGNPTVMVNVALNHGLTATACVLSGASTGIGEAVELRAATPNATAAGVFLKPWRT